MFKLITKKNIVTYHMRECTWWARPGNVTKIPRKTWSSRRYSRLETSNIQCETLRMQKSSIIGNEMMGVVSSMRIYRVKMNKIIPQTFKVECQSGTIRLCLGKMTIDVGNRTHSRDIVKNYRYERREVALKMRWKRMRR